LGEWQSALQAPQGLRFMVGGKEKQDSRPHSCGSMPAMCHSPINFNATTGGGSRLCQLYTALPDPGPWIWILLAVV
jgi:hypothetical protein